MLFLFKDSLIIEINKKFIDDFLTKLKIYKLRSQVKIEEINDLSSFIILRSSKYHSMEQGSIITNSDYIEYIDPRNMKLGHRILLKNKFVDRITKNKDFELGDIKEYHRIMIQNLIPNSISDLVINKSLLLENNFDHINALDWDKGCYIGQEKYSSHEI